MVACLPVAVSADNKRLILGNSGQVGNTNTVCHAGDTSIFCLCFVSGKDEEGTSFTGDGGLFPKAEGFHWDVRVVAETEETVVAIAKDSRVVINGAEEDPVNTAVPEPALGGE